MKLAHVSDLHILSPEAEAPGPGPTSIDVAEALADDLKAIAEGLDLVIIAGDLTDRADAPSFAIVERLFARVGLPIFVVPGNHDGPSGMIDYMRTSTTLSDWDLTNRVVEFGGFRFLGLNTCIEGRIQGALDDSALALVDREVGRNSDLPLVVIMHHPPLFLGLEQFDGFCDVDRGDEFLGLLAAAKAETLVFSGHVHRPYAARIDSLICHVAGSMITPYDSLRPFGTDPIRPTVLQDIYFVHEIDPGGQHVVTPQRVLGLVSHASEIKRPSQSEYDAN
ncbi:MAG: metallophosphoesterase [Rhodobacteraceae bacterium]|nr:metallophosphoesterase [Paracoccaceae bacterium]MCY4138371.1 metallophosphoesterase [Paracoccaceae bacterium]